MKRLFFATAVALALAATAIVSAGQGPGAAPTASRPTSSRASSCAASGRRSPPGASSTSRSIRRTRTSGTSRARSAACGRPSTAASPSTPIFDDGGVVHALLRRHRSEGLERRLARHRREQQPAQRALRRRRLQVDRRRQDVEAGGPRDVRAHRQDPRSTRATRTSSTSRRRGRSGPPGGERGLYKTTDGGATWTAVLTISPDTGISDIVFDPKNAGHHLRVGLPAAPRGRPDDRRRARGRHLQDDQRRQDVDEADEGAADRATWAAPASRSTAARRRRRCSRSSTRSASEAGLLPLGRRRHDVGAHRPDAGHGGGRGGAGRQAARARRPAPAGAAAQAAGAGGTGGRPRPAAAPAGAPAPGGAAGAAAPPSDDWYRGGGAAYYHEIFVDPHRPDTICSMNVNVERSTDGGKTWGRTNWENTGVHVDHHDARVRPDRPAPHPARQRRRPLRDVRRGRDVALLRQPADHAVLPRVGRQREAVLQRLRRHAGQLVALRPVAHD